MPAPTTKPYKVLLGPIATDRIAQTGETINLTDEQAQPLLALKAIAVIAEPKPVSQPVTTEITAAGGIEADSHSSDKTSKAKKSTAAE